MAKKEKAAAAPKIVNVQDLAKKYDLEPRKVRMIIREAGFRAPAVEQKEGAFGPKSKYEWEEGSKELARIEKALTEATEGGEKTSKKAKADKDEKPAKGKKAAKAAEPEEDEDEDENEDEDEDEDEDEE